MLTPGNEVGTLLICKIFLSHRSRVTVLLGPELAFKTRNRVIMRNYQASAVKQMKTALFWVIIMRNYQASAAKQMKTALFWVITLRLVVISYRRFGTNKKFFGLLTPDYGTNRLSRNVG